MKSVKVSATSAKDSSFLRALHSWYQKEKRDLPWRRNPAPYNVWVSEIMLQQTQVKTVLPYYDRFLNRFPDFATLARADESDVLAQWSGLGYYSRARNMHRCAQAVMEQFGGKFPDELEVVKTLPGIGPYTAGAILSIAFNKPYPILDGNVRRILSRIYLETDESELWRAAERLIVRSSAMGMAPSDVNQALMELGALVCQPSGPACLVCPVRKVCGALEKGRQSSYPPAKKKLETVRKRFNMYVISRENSWAELLIRRRAAEERWLKNMWEFPMLETPSERGATSGNLSEISKLLGGARVTVTRRLGGLVHTITRHRLYIEVLEARASGQIRTGEDIRWVTLSNLPQFSSSSLLGKALALLN